MSNSSLDRGFDNQSIAGDIGFSFGKLETSFSLWNTKGTTEYLVFGSPVSQDYKNEALATELKFITEHGYHVLFNINTSEDLINQNNQNYLGVLDLTQTKRKSYELLVHKKIKQTVSYSVGLEAENEKVNYSSYGTNFKRDLATRAPFGTFEWEQDNNSLIGSVRESNHDLYGKLLSWNIGFLRLLTEEWAFYLSSGSAFRSPNSSELYGFGSNQKLLPEVSYSREVGLTKTIKDSTLKIVTFTTNTLNLINFDYSDYVLKNIEEASNSGIELRYKWSNAYLDGSLILRKQNPEDQNKKQLLRRSKLSTSLNISKNISGYKLNINVSAFDRRTDVGDIPLPGYALINAAAKKQLTEYYLNQDRSLWLKIAYELR